MYLKIERITVICIQSNSRGGGGFSANFSFSPTDNFLLFTITFSQNYDFKFLTLWTFLHVHREIVRYPLELHKIELSSLYFEHELPQPLIIVMPF